MTDSGPHDIGTDPGSPRPAGPTAAGGTAPPGGGASGPPAPGTGGARPRRRWLRWTALGACVLVLAAAGTGWSLYRKLDGNIRTDVDTTQELRRHEAERPAPPTVGPGGPGKPENILLLGSDNRGDGNGAYGRDSGTQRSDTAILLHVAGDRHSATAVSLPRDLMVHIPSCAGRDGGPQAARFAQFNWAFSFGGPACTIRTVEQLTGVRIDHHLVVDFNGFKKLVDAVDGVDVCVPEAVHDPKARLDLAAGRQTLDGEQALAYVRARYSLGDGSDTERMGRQQQFLGSLVKKVRGDGVLLNPAKLYPVLDSATSALTADPGLDSLGELYDLAREVRDIPTDQVRFLTVPRRPYALDANRDELMQPQADALFAALRADRPVRVVDGGGTPGGAPSPGATPTSAATSAPGGSPGATPRPPAAGEVAPAGRPAGSGNRRSADAVDSSVRQSPGRNPGADDGPSGGGAPSFPGSTAARDICAADDAGNAGN